MGAGSGAGSMRGSGGIGGIGGAGREETGPINLDSSDDDVIFVGSNGINGANGASGVSGAPGATPGQKRRKLNRNDSTWSNASAPKSSARRAPKQPQPPKCFFTAKDASSEYFKSLFRNELRAQTTEMLRKRYNPRLHRIAVGAKVGLGAKVLKQPHPQWVKKVLMSINTAKTRAEPPGEFRDEFRFVYEWYLNKLRGNAAMDFNDILWNCHWLLKNCEDIREAVRKVGMC